MRLLQVLILSYLMTVSAVGNADEFDALDLLKSYRFALQQDADYRAAQASADAGREAVNMALAQLLPNVSANYSRFSNDLETQSENLRGAKTTTESRYPSSNTSLALRQPLYRPFLYAGYEQSQARVEGVEAELNKALQDLGVRVAVAYFSILLAEEGLKYLQTQQTAIRAQLEAAELGMKTGMGTRTDLDDATARLDFNLAEELSARQQIDQSKYELGILINHKVTSVLPFDSSKFEPEKLVYQQLETWLQKAENASPELKKLRAEMEVNRLEIRRAEAGHKPTVDLVLQYSNSESDNVTNPNARYINNQVGVQVTLPIYAGGYVDAQIRQADAAFRASEERYEAARRKLETVVRKEFKLIEQSIQKLAALSQAEASAYQAVRSNYKGLEAGTRTRLDILDAEERLGQARFNLAKEQLMFVMARVRLLSLCDTLDEQEIQQVNVWLSQEKKLQLQMAHELLQAGD